MGRERKRKKFPYKGVRNGGVESKRKSNVLFPGQSRDEGKHIKMHRPDAAVTINETNR
jgi:hypothetical protein